MRPPGKARRPRISGIFEGGVTQPGGMQCRPNAGGLAPRAARRETSVKRNKTMLIKRPADIPSSEITSKTEYLNRRSFIQTAGGTAIAAAGIGLFWGAEGWLRAQEEAAHGRKLDNVQKSPLSTDAPPNSWKDITTYNNYYEFGIDKE